MQQLFKQQVPQSAMVQMIARQLAQHSRRPIRSPLEGALRLGETYLLRQGIEKESARQKAEKQAATAALIKGLNAKPWTPPEGELIEDEQGYEISPEEAAKRAAPTGGFAGAAYALGNLEGNATAQDLAATLAMQGFNHRQARAMKAEDRANAMADAKEIATHKAGLKPAPKPKPGVDIPFSPEVAAQKIEIGKSNRPTNVGTIPPGYQLEQNGNTYRMVPIPGSPAAQKASEGEDAVKSRSAALDQNIKLVEDLIQHPGMSDVVGVPGSVSGAVTRVTGHALPATDAAGFQSKLKQIQGKLFLEAFENLKGGGQITEAEGRKATDAMSRLGHTEVRESEYRAAAEELLSVFRAARERMKSGVKPQSNSTAGKSRLSDKARKYLEQYGK